MSDPTPSVQPADQPTPQDPAHAAHLARVARSRRRRFIVQIVGLILAIASLAWCIHMALRPENREQWARLGDATSADIALILGLSAAALLLEGLSFWVVLRPVHRLRLPDMLATNALCTFLAYMPFKISAIMRFVIHNRRDGVPVPTIAAWLGNFGSIMLAVFLAMLALLAAMGGVSLEWALATLAATAAIAAGLVAIGRVFRGEQGIDRLVAVLIALRLKRLVPLVRTRTWRSLHAGFDMHASSACVSAACALRLLHAGVLTWRFVAVAAVLGVAMPIDVALPVGIAFFVIGSASPAGMAGLRETGAAGLAGLMLSASGTESATLATYAPVAILLSATEAIVFLVCGALGLAWLRPDRLLKLRDAPTPRITA